MIHIISSDGYELWHNKNGYHRIDDGPVIIYPNGNEYWSKNDKLYRINNPALINVDGREHWNPQ